jgi:hypothetical protein
VVRFFPESAFYELTAQSERALLYGTEPLAHRFLVIAEWAALAGREFGPYLLRSLISEQRLRYEVVELDPKTNQHVTRLIERPGPTSALISTTDVVTDDQLETRLMSVTVSDTAEQTAAVLGVLADETPHSVDLGSWLALQRWLERGPREVTIPFAPALAKLVPPKAVRLRRDFGALLVLIRACALLHQANRRRDRAGRIVATLEDYDTVRALVGGTIAAAVEATVPATVRELVAAIPMLGDEKTGVTRRKLAEALSLDVSSISRRVKRAESYVVNLEDRRNKAARYWTGDPLPDDVEILPSLDRLADACWAEA